MKFSMNGFRKGLSWDIQTLRDVVWRAANGKAFDPDELIDAANAVISHSNVINCVYDDNDPEFSDLSHIEVKSIEPLDD